MRLQMHAEIWLALNGENLNWCSAKLLTAVMFATTFFGLRTGLRPCALERLREHGTAQQRPAWPVDILSSLAVSEEGRMFRLHGPFYLKHPQH